MGARAKVWIPALLLAALLPSCASSTLKATPIWDEEFARAEGPPEDRINIWPLLYYRKPALSVLWPLFSATDEGQAFVPFYAYDRRSQALSVITASPWLPAAAQLEPEYKRIGNVIWNGSTERFSIFPLFFRDPRALLLAPLFYTDADGFWTFPWTRFRREKREVDGWLAPALLHVRDTREESWHLAWPLLAAWREEEERGMRALPLFWLEREPDRSLLNVGGLLFHREVDGERLWAFWLWPLGAAKRDGETRGSRFLPLWYSDAKDGASLFASLPYQERRAPGYLWQSAFGIAHRIRADDGGGHALLPLYWRHRSETSDTLLTLAGGYSRSADRTFTDVLGPLYWSRSTRDARTTGVLWPLLEQQSRPVLQETRLLLGAAGFASGEVPYTARMRLWAYPFLDWSVGESDSSFWTPLFQHRRSDDGIEVGGLLGMLGMGRRVSRDVVRLPSGEVGMRTRTARTSFVRPLWLLPLWERSDDEQASSTELLWRLYDSRTRLQDDGATYTRQRVLWRLFHRETLGTRSSLDVFPFIAYDRDEDLLHWSFMGGLLGWEHTADARTVRVLGLPLSLAPKPGAPAKN
jgi:hypothetical protein